MYTGVRSPEGWCLDPRGEGAVSIPVAYQRLCFPCQEV